MPSPARYREHGKPHFHSIGWLGVYSAATPGVEGGDNATLRLDFENEPQPDALLRLPPEYGGSSQVGEDGYLEGTPELILEVSASSASYDLNQKKRVYARNGVPEYIVYLAYEQRVVWHVLRAGVYEEQQPDEGGVLKSERFPGLWLQPDALLAGDLSRVLETLQQGACFAGTQGILRCAGTERQGGQINLATPANLAVPDYLLTTTRSVRKRLDLNRRDGPLGEEI